MSALREQFRAFVDENLSPAARSHVLADQAKHTLADLVNSGRASPVYVRYVDGREGAPEESVRGTGGGEILYVFSYQARAAVFALEFLRQRSPRASGRFANSFWIGVDGRYIAPGDFNPGSVAPFAEIVIGNTQPQSRKIDVQFAGSRPLHFSVPAGLFDDCVRAVARQFGNVVQAKRVYDMDFPGKYRLRQHQRRHTGRRAGQIVRSAGEFVQSPAIVLNAVR